MDDKLIGLLFGAGVTLLVSLLGILSKKLENNHNYKIESRKNKKLEELIKKLMEWEWSELAYLHGKKEFESFDMK